MCRHCQAPVYYKMSWFDLPLHTPLAIYDRMRHWSGSIPSHYFHDTIGAQGHFLSLKRQGQVLPVFRFDLCECYILAHTIEKRLRI